MAKWVLTLDSMIRPEFDSIITSPNPEGVEEKSLSKEQLLSLLYKEPFGSGKMTSETYQKKKKRKEKEEKRRWKKRRKIKARRYELIIKDTRSSGTTTVRPAPCATRSGVTLWNTYPTPFSSLSSLCFLPLFFIFIIFF